MNIKEKLKVFWERYKENWLWVDIGGYIVLALMNQKNSKIKDELKKIIP